VCVALFAVAFGTNVPPLLLVYEQRLHLSAAALTAMFGAYAVGLVPALLVSGPVPGVVAADLVLVLADLALGALEGLLNGPAGHDRTRLKISAAVVTRTASR
jgi:hypothetical protein